MKKRKLNYRFHNPNPVAETADYLLKILIEANTEKVQSAIQEAATEYDYTIDAVTGNVLEYDVDSIYD